MQADYRVDSIYVDEETGEIFAKCYDNVYGEKFEKYLGNPKEHQSSINASIMLEDSNFGMTDELRNEIISTFGLEDLGHEMTFATDEYDDEIYAGNANGIVTEDELDAQYNVEESFNLREALNRIDIATDNKFDLRNLYESVDLRDEDKEKLATLIYDQEDPSIIYDTLNNKFLESIGMNEEDKSPVVHKKSDGSYLVASESGDGYTAFNKDDVCQGHISANNENEAKSKFNSNKFDESLDEDLSEIPSDYVDYCPDCMSRSLTHKGDGKGVCDSCGAKFTLVPGTNNQVKILPDDTSIESLVDGSKLDIIEYGEIDDVHSFKATYTTGENAGQTYLFIEADVNGTRYLRKLGLGEDDGQDFIDLPTEVLKGANFEGSFYITENDFSEYMNESLENGSEEDSYNKKEVTSWLENHSTAYEDITDFFGSADLSEIDLESILGWISEHDELYDDFLRFFEMDDESLVEDLVPGRSIEISDGDGEECPYLVGSSTEKMDIDDRYNLSEDELWATGWIASVQNKEDGPFESFDKIDLFCYDEEKGEEYSLPEIPEDIKSKFLKMVNDYINTNNTNESLTEASDITWRDVYKIFLDIIDANYVGGNEAEISRDVEMLYRKHDGEPAWDEAWLRWLDHTLEPGDEGFEEADALYRSELKRIRGRKLEESTSSKKTFAQWFDETQCYGDDTEFYPFDNYVKNFPNAEALRNTTALDIVNNAHKFHDIYDVDSDDRMKAFIFASEELNIDEDILYKAWLRETPIAGVNESFESGSWDTSRVTDLVSHYLTEFDSMSIEQLQKKIWVTMEEECSKLPDVDTFKQYVADTAAHFYEEIDSLGEGYELSPRIDYNPNHLRDDEGKIMADKWYASKWPDDEVGIEQLQGITLDDALKDRKILDHCDTQVRERVYAQLDKYIPLSVDSPMYKEKNESKSIHEDSDGNEVHGSWSVDFDITFEGEETSFDNLSETTQEHIAESIKEGYAQGEIVEEEGTGWWVAKIECYLDNKGDVLFDSLDEASQEHIADSIKDGYTSGELCVWVDGSIDESKSINESRPDKDIKTTTNKVTIKYGNSVKEVETCKPIKVTQDQLDSYKDNYSIVDVLTESKSINESTDIMIYLFPELTDKDLEMVKAYGLQLLGINHGAYGDEENWVVRGQESSLRMFADKYLGYKLYPDYLYDEDDFAGDIEPLKESITNSPLSTVGPIPYAVKLLYQMDRFVMDVYDNEGWLMNGVPDGEFEETTADEAMQNYNEHAWLIEDEDSPNGVNWDDFNDFIDTFSNVTESRDYDQEERSRIIDEADTFVREYAKYGDDNDEKLSKMLDESGLQETLDNNDLQNIEIAMKRAITPLEDNQQKIATALGRHHEVIYKAVEDKQ